jgi:hypothetical protein
MYNKEILNIIYLILIIICSGIVQAETDRKFKTINGKNIMIEINGHQINMTGYHEHRVGDFTKNNNTNNYTNDFYRSSNNSYIHKRECSCTMSFSKGEWFNVMQSEQNILPPPGSGSTPTKIYRLSAIQNGGSWECNHQYGFVQNRGLFSQICHENLYVGNIPYTSTRLHAGWCNDNNNPHQINVYDDKWNYVAACYTDAALWDFCSVKPLFDVTWISRALICY